MEREREREEAGEKKSHFPSVKKLKTFTFCVVSFRLLLSGSVCVCVCRAQLKMEKRANTISVIMFSCSIRGEQQLHLLTHSPSERFSGNWIIIALHPTRTVEESRDKAYARSVWCLSIASHRIYGSWSLSYTRDLTHNNNNNDKINRKLNEINYLRWIYHSLDALYLPARLNGDSVSTKLHFLLAFGSANVCVALEMKWNKKSHRESRVENMKKWSNSGINFSVSMCVRLKRWRRQHLPFVF